MCTYYAFAGGDEGGDLCRNFPCGVNAACRVHNNQPQCYCPPNSPSGDPDKLCEFQSFTSSLLNDDVASIVLHTHMFFRSKQVLQNEVRETAANSGVEKVPNAYEMVQYSCVDALRVPAVPLTLNAQQVGDDLLTV